MKKGFSQKDFAKALETSQSAVTRMEKGQQNFSTVMLTKISRILNQNIIELSSGAMDFKIEGGYKLSGTVTTNTAKNSAVCLLMASLLNKGKTTLKEMPKIEEVHRIIEVLTSIGVTIRWLKDDLEIIPPKKFNLENINLAAAEKTRSIIMLLGPLIHELENFALPEPGGCKLGSRTVQPHLFALEEFGVKIKNLANKYQISALKTKPANVILYESGDTVTENALMAAAKIPATSTIKYASANYMVQDLCFFLEKLGVRIEGLGTTTLKVTGVKEIDKDIVYSLSEDPIEAMLFLAIAATTKSSLLIKRCPIDFLELELLKLKKMGFKYKILSHYKSKNGRTNLVNIQTRPSQLKSLNEKIYARPYPGLNIDNLPFFVPIASQAKGITLIHDWIYENRAIYYLELNKLGANVILADPHRVYVEGITTLKGDQIICPPALRAGAIILIAMLAAKGTSILRNVYSINRGYEDLCSRLQKLGAHIEVIQSH